MRCGRKAEHMYRGHRAHSFNAIDEAELTELRARQRTFDGAAYRTALGNLSYAAVVLRLFDQRFYRIGILYTVLSTLLFILAFIRSRHSNHDFSDHHRIPQQASTGRRIFGRSFVTAGWSVVAVSAVVAIVEVVLLVLILRI